MTLEKLQRIEKNILHATQRFGAHIALPEVGITNHDANYLIVEIYRLRHALTIIREQVKFTMGEEP